MANNQATSVRLKPIVSLYDLIPIILVGLVGFFYPPFSSPKFETEWINFIFLGAITSALAYLAFLMFSVISFGANYYLANNIRSYALIKFTYFMYWIRVHMLCSYVSAVLIGVAVRQFSGLDNPDAVRDSYGTSIVVCFFVLYATLVTTYLFLHRNELGKNGILISEPKNMSSR